MGCCGGKGRHGTCTSCWLDFILQYPQGDQRQALCLVLTTDLLKRLPPARKVRRNGHPNETPKRALVRKPPLVLQRCPEVWLPKKTSVRQLWIPKKERECIEPKRHVPIFNQASWLPKNYWSIILESVLVLVLDPILERERTAHSHSLAFFGGWAGGRRE